MVWQLLSRCLGKSLCLLINTFPNNAYKMGSKTFMYLRATCLLESPTEVDRMAHH